MDDGQQEVFKSGFVGIIGRPNVGKSTFLNRVIGEKVAIVTEKPQTTRDRIMGILHFEGGQIVFLDTPGVHRGAKPLNRQMVRIALQSFENTEALFHLFEPPIRELGYPKAQEGLYLDEENSLLLEHLARAEGRKFLIINKVDVLDDEVVVGGLRGRAILDPLVELIRGVTPFDETFAISAATGEGIDPLLEAAKACLPLGPPYFPEDMFTNQTDRSFAAEVVREKVFLLTTQEIPYSTAVTIEEFDDSEEITNIRATIHVERESQKGILVGRKGQMIKALGIAARTDLEDFLGCRVFLKLNVQVSKDWSRDERITKRLEYGA